SSSVRRTRPDVTGSFWRRVAGQLAGGGGPWNEQNDRPARSTGHSRTHVWATGFGGGKRAGRPKQPTAWDLALVLPAFMPQVEREPRVRFRHPCGKGADHADPPDRHASRRVAPPVHHGIG